MNKIILAILNRFIISITKKNLMYQITDILDLCLTKKSVYKSGSNILKFLNKTKQKTLNIIIKIMIVNKKYITLNNLLLCC